MEFTANANKNVSIETSTGDYDRCAIQTHFIQIGEEWVDITDPELMTRLGIDRLSPELQEEVTMPGDPCITVLFK